jgi:hypothetical protein
VNTLYGMWTAGRREPNGKPQFRAHDYGRITHADFSRGYLDRSWTARVATTRSRLRVALAWNSRTTGILGIPVSSMLDADLDLHRFAPDGSLVATSSSWDNSWEMVEVSPRQVGNYTIKGLQHAAHLRELVRRGLDGALRPLLRSTHERPARAARSGAAAAGIRARRAGPPAGPARVPLRRLPSRDRARSHDPRGARGHPLTRHRRDLPSRRAASARSRGWCVGPGVGTPDLLAIMLRHPELDGLRVRVTTPSGHHETNASVAEVAALAREPAVIRVDLLGEPEIPDASDA